MQRAKDIAAFIACALGVMLMIMALHGCTAAQEDAAAAKLDSAAAAAQKAQNATTNPIVVAGATVIPGGPGYLNIVTEGLGGLVLLLGGLSGWLKNRSANAHQTVQEVLSVATGVAQAADMLPTLQAGLAQVSDVAKGVIARVTGASPAAATVTVPTAPLPAGTIAAPATVVSPPANIATKPATVVVAPPPVSPAP